MSKRLIIKTFDVIVVGGGAAGFFGAINISLKSPHLKIAILEKSNGVLQKVKISGGGRCNVTHACFDPKELTEFYPRGYKELLGPFHTFQCGDTLQWFQDQDINLKIEQDNRIFPESDSSSTIINCFLSLTKKFDIYVGLQTGIDKIEKVASGFELHSSNQIYKCSQVLFSAGSSPMAWDLLKKLGHTIIPPVPSLFTFNIKNPLLQDLQGISFPMVTVEIEGQSLETDGPLLITHWGLSGPAVLKLSAWGARKLADLNYRFSIKVNFLPNYDIDSLFEKFKESRVLEPKKRIVKSNEFGITQRFWERVISLIFALETSWADAKNDSLYQLAGLLTQNVMQVQGKSTFKDEFVTAGGVNLKEVDFKKMESRVVPGLYLAGETLDIDAVTGGFNFQAAWTTSYIAASAIAEL